MHNVQYSTEAVCYSCSIIYLEFRFDCMECAALDSVPWLFLQLWNLVQCFCFMFFFWFFLSFIRFVFVIWFSFYFVYSLVMPWHQFCISHIQRRDAYRSRKSEKRLKTKTISTITTNNNNSSEFLYTK